jgi:hypothetical protein
LTISAEIIVFIGTALLGALSFCGHLLIGINRQMGQICTAHAVAQVKTTERLEALARHQERNDAETRSLRIHLRQPEPLQR